MKSLPDPWMHFYGKEAGMSPQNVKRESQGCGSNKEYQEKTVFLVA